MPVTLSSCTIGWPLRWEGESQLKTSCSRTRSGSDSGFLEPGWHGCLARFAGDTGRMAPAGFGSGRRSRRMTGDGMLRFQSISLMQSGRRRHEGKHGGTKGGTKEGTKEGTKGGTKGGTGSQSSPSKSRALVRSRLAHNAFPSSPSFSTSFSSSSSSTFFPSGHRDHQDDRATTSVN
jgi:hypothetical protein